MHGVVLCDVHSGDGFGLCDPANVPKNRDRAKHFAQLQFDWYAEKIIEIGKIDWLGCAGECLEGEGLKDTIELWTTDPEEQADAFADLMCMWPCDEFHLCYGSHYHNGGTTNIDHMAVKEMKLRGKKVDIKTVQRLRSDDVYINMYHRVGGSRTPHGWASQIASAATTDIFRAAYRGYRKADLYFRGHTHQYGFAGNDMFTAVNGPSLKWPDGRYGRAIDRPFYAQGLIEVFTDGADFDWKLHKFSYRLPEEKYARIG